MERRRKWIPEIFLAVNQQEIVTDCTLCKAQGQRVFH